MSEKRLTVVLETRKSAKILKWKIKADMVVSVGRVILLYDTHPNNGEAGHLKLKSTVVGTVKKLLAKEGEIIGPGEPLFELEKCTHPTVMKDMCAECGADLRNEEGNGNADVGSIAMVHSIPDLKVNEEEALILGKADEQRLLTTRKLVLLVDLDQTLIHTTNDNIPPNLKDVYHFQLHGGMSPWYHTRLRPGTGKFLIEMSKIYELHICTFGSRTYAHMIAKFLDPDGNFFSHRILSRDECFSANCKTANLKALFPCGDSLVCIIDDREDVWSFVPNLIHVKPYHFFQHTGDINAPPGLSKKENDDEGDYDFNCLGDGKKPENDEIPPKPKPEKKTAPSSASGDGLGVEETKAVTVSEQTKKEETPTENQSPVNHNSESAAVTQENSKEETVENKAEIPSEIAAPDNTTDTETPNPVADLSEKTSEVADLSEKTSKVVDLSEKTSEVPDLSEKTSEVADVSENTSEVTPNTNADSGTTEEKNDSESIKEVNNSEITENNSENCTATKTQNEENNSENNGEIEKEVKQEKVKESRKVKGEPIEIITSNESVKQKKVEDDEIDVEDADDYLMYLEEILKSIHHEFYFRKDAGETPDLKRIVPEIKARVLKGTSLVFSGLVPNHVQLEHSRAYQVAVSLGANVTQDLVKGVTTHLVAVRPGTAKVNSARRMKNIFMVTADWLWTCAERWERVEEKVFPLGRNCAGSRHPPAHCSPEHPPTETQVVQPAVRNRSPSGRFMDTINPLLSFSSADIADMDQEVEDIFNESESDGEGDGDGGGGGVGGVGGVGGEETTLRPKRPVRRRQDQNDSDGRQRNKRPRAAEPEVETESSSSSADSLSGEHPRGWKQHELRKERRGPAGTGTESDPEEDLEESPSSKFRRGEALPSDLDLGEDESASQGSDEPIDEVDDGDWNMMGAALEREFLS